MKAASDNIRSFVERNSSLPSGAKLGSGEEGPGIEKVSPEFSAELKELTKELERARGKSSSSNFPLWIALIMFCVVAISFTSSSFFLKDSPSLAAILAGEGTVLVLMVGIIRLLVASVMKAKREEVLLDLVLKTIRYFKSPSDIILLLQSLPALLDQKLS